MKKGDTWTDDEGTNIKITIESDKESDGKYRMSVNKPGFVPVIMRQTSLPTDEERQDKMLKKLDGMKFNLLTDEWKLSSDKSINYIAQFVKF